MVGLRENVGMRRMQRIFLAACVLALVAGCAIKALTADQLSGTYRSQNSYGEEILVLQKDGVLLHQFHFNSGKVIENMAAWKPFMYHLLPSLYFVGFKEFYEHEGVIKQGNPKEAGLLGPKVVRGKVRRLEYPSRGQVVTFNRVETNPGKE